MFGDPAILGNILATQRAIIEEMLLSVAFAIVSIASTASETSHSLTMASINQSNALYLTPTDDVWVYQHAGDPQKDEFLRAWGSEGRAVANSSDDPLSFSYSLLRWDLSSFRKDAKVEKAELVLTIAPEPGFTAANAKDTPVQIRAAKGAFNEQEWNLGNADRFAPGSDELEVLGWSAPDVVAPEAKIVIDLLRGPGDFKQVFRNAQKSNRPFLALALTSAMDPQQLSTKGIYKVYSKDAKEPSFRPVLKLTLSP